MSKQKQVLCTGCDYVLEEYREIAAQLRDQAKEAVGDTIISLLLGNYSKAVKIALQAPQIAEILAHGKKHSQDILNIAKIPCPSCREFHGWVSSSQMN